VARRAPRSPHSRGAPDARRHSKRHVADRERKPQRHASRRARKPAPQRVSNCGQAAGTGLSAAVRGGCCVKASEKLPNLTGRRRIGFVALARVSSHLPATLARSEHGSSHHRSTHRIRKWLCNSQVGSGRPSDHLHRALLLSWKPAATASLIGAAGGPSRPTSPRSSSASTSRGMSSARPPDRLAVCMGWCANRREGRMTRGKSVAAADERTSSSSRGVRLLSKRSNPGDAAGTCRGRLCRWRAARLSARGVARPGVGDRALRGGRYPGPKRGRGGGGWLAGAISRRSAVMATGWPRPRRSSPTPDAGTQGRPQGVVQLSPGGAASSAVETGFPAGMASAPPAVSGSIVWASWPPPICTRRGLAASATGIVSVSTPCS
jgi:hypothetical protein